MRIWANGRKLTSSTSTMVPNPSHFCFVCLNVVPANTTNALCVYEGVIQPTLFEISPGKIMALLRSGCRVIAQSWSIQCRAIPLPSSSFININFLILFESSGNDFGKTWDSTAAPISLPNPNAGETSHTPLLLS